MGLWSGLDSTGNLRAVGGFLMSEDGVVAEVHECAVRGEGVERVEERLAPPIWSTRHPLR